MGTAPYKLELFVPDCEGKRIVAMQVPFEAARLRRNWDVDEGGVRWTIAGQVLTDVDEFYLYPGNQLDTVLDLVRASLEYRDVKTSLPGSIIMLRTLPRDAQHAVWMYDITARTRRWRVVAEHRAVVGDIKQVTRSVLACVEMIGTRLDSIAGHGRDDLPSVWGKAAEVERLLRSFPPKKPKPRHGR